MADGMGVADRIQLWRGQDECDATEDYIELLVDAEERIRELERSVEDAHTVAGQLQRTAQMLGAMLELAPAEPMLRRLNIRRKSATDAERVVIDALLEEFEQVRLVHADENGVQCRGCEMGIDKDWAKKYDGLCSVCFSRVVEGDTDAET